MVDKFRRKSRFKGPVTMEASETHQGAESHAGAQTGVRRDAQVNSTAGTIVLTAAQSGQIIRATLGSDTQTFELPAATAKGVQYTFICGHASGEILIDPAGSDKIKCKATNDDGASIAPAGGTGIKNTAGTNIIGDYITLVADGVDQWDTIGQSGIFAAQS